MTETHLFPFHRGFTYYKMGNVDNRVVNPDQLLTQDVDRFCNSVVELYSNISKVSWGCVSHHTLITGPNAVHADHWP